MQFPSELQAALLFVVPQQPVVPRRDVRGRGIAARPGPIARPSDRSCSKLAEGLAGTLEVRARGLGSGGGGTPPAGPGGRPVLGRKQA